jgi:hypothetical protein
LPNLDEDPFLYHKEDAQIILEQTGQLYTDDQIRQALDKEGYTRKKLDLRAMEQSEPLRRMYFSHMEKLCPSQLVFVDESHVNEEDVRRQYGYAIHGQPAFVYEMYHTEKQLLYQ